MNQSEQSIKGQIRKWLSKLLTGNSYQGQSSSEMVETLRQATLRALSDIIYLLSRQLTLPEIHAIANEYGDYKQDHSLYQRLIGSNVDTDKSLRSLIIFATQQQDIDKLISIIKDLRPELGLDLMPLNRSPFQTPPEKSVDVKAWNKAWQLVAEAREIDTTFLKISSSVEIRDAVDYLVATWDGQQLLEERLRLKEAERIHAPVNPSLLGTGIKNSPLPTTLVEIEDSQDVTVASGDVTNINIGKLVIEQESYNSTQVKSIASERKDAMASNKALAQYLNRVIADYERPNWGPIQSYARETKLIRLRHIYVKLNARVAPHSAEDLNRDQEDDEADRVLTIPQALRDSNKKLVLLGDPGAGKTTLLRYLALVYADSLRLKTDRGSVSKELGLDEDGLIPIYIPVSSFGASLKPMAQVTPESLIGYIQFSLKEMGLLDAFSEIEKSLGSGNCIVLLDGLDEVSNPGIKDKILHIIDGFVKDDRYKDNRFVVSSRVLGYKDNAKLKTDFFEAIIRPFDVDDIRQFVNNYCIRAAISKVADEQNLTSLEEDTQIIQRVVPEARVTAVRLIGKILGNPALMNLATNPLLLTIICIVFRSQVEKGSKQNIPDRKIDLVQRCTEVLIEIWPRSRDLSGDMQQDFETKYDREEWVEHKLQILKLIAFHMQETGRYTLSLKQVRTLVNGYLDEEYERARRDKLRTLFFAESEAILHCRQFDEFSFVHPIFREYHTAAHIVQSESQSVKTVMNYVDDPAWHEVVVYATSLMAEQMNNQSLAAELILQMSSIEDLQNQYMRLQTAAESLVEIGVSQNRDIQRANAYTKEQLMQAIQSEELQLRKRIKLADLLGRLGDPRVDPNKPPEMVPVKAGTVKVQMQGAELEYSLPDFWISKYLVTNEQFSRFVQDKPQFMPEHWIREGYPSIYPNHPVVDIPWATCSEFCNWLAQLYNHSYRLPYDYEWQVVAGWRPEEKITYKYPWGMNWDPSKCNSRPTGIGATTTPIGVFYSGRSYFNVFDLAGNVWEWTGTPWTIDNSTLLSTQDFDHMKIAEVVICGGSFSGIDPSQFAVQNRQRYPVEGFGGYLVHRNIGFRVAYST